MTDKEFWAGIRHFRPREFDSPDGPGSGMSMSRELVALLDELRKKVGRPININSGYRTRAHNGKVGGKRTSAHLKGRAVDIAVRSSRKRMQIIRAALELGFTRVGVGKAFVHLDVDDTKPQDVCWTY